MQFSWSDPTAIMFAIYLVAMLGIGAIGYLGTKNLSDYILGGRSLGSVVTALSAGASDMSGWLLMGLPGAVYPAYEYGVVRYIFVQYRYFGTHS